MPVLLLLLFALQAPPTNASADLIDAAADGRVKDVESLLRAGADANAKDQDDVSALMRAAAANRVAVVTLLLASGADPNAAMKDGATALTAAAFGGYADVVRALIGKRAKPDPTDRYGRTPLMAAALNGHPAVVDLLVASGANIRAADANGATALTYAAAKGHADIVDRLASAGVLWGETEVGLAAAACRGDVLDWMLKHGVRPNAAADGRPLIVASAAGGCVDSVRALTAAGADVNAKDANGVTALMESAKAGSPDIVSMLLANGADPTAMDALDRTPAMFAALSRQDDVMRMLAPQAAPQRIVVESPALKADQPIPRDYTADGRNVSPPLAWTGVPAGAKELAVVCEDPDAGNPPPFVHWVIYGIPATAKGLPENIPFEPGAPMPREVAGAVQGTSGFRRAIYRGPAPPPGKVHHYHFVVYALDTELDLKPGLTRAELLAAMQGHVIGQGELVATYERKAPQP